MEPESSEWVSTDTLPKFPDEIDESESPTLRGLCSPNPATDPCPTDASRRYHDLRLWD